MNQCKKNSFLMLLMLSYLLSSLFPVSYLFISSLKMNKPIIPVYSSNITIDNLVEYFDERTIINDDLNMQGFCINNFKNPKDDDVVNKTC